MKSSLLVVTGAPGAGKSTLAQSMLLLDHEFMVFDIDWLIDEGSDLIRRNLQVAPEAWPAWGRLWFGILNSVVKNRQKPIFFCPNTPLDFENFGVPDWIDSIHWLHLDCTNDERRSRLVQRGWSATDIEAALADAEALRQAIPDSLMSDQMPVEELVAQLLSWSRSHS